MNVSTQPIVLPTTHRRRFLTTAHKPTFIDGSPIAVSNKIKAIQARKIRLNPLPNDTNYTDIRPLNFGYTGGIANSKANVWTAERLVDRSKIIRLDRIATRQPTRPSILSSTTTINQQSLSWPNCQSSNLGNKQLQTHSNSTTITPPVFGSIKNKSPGGKISEIPQHRTRPPLIDRQNSLPPIEQQKQLHSLPRTIHNNLLTYDIQQEDDDENENENVEEDLLIDKEFQQYLEKAIVKCADWLIKYVFKEKDN